MSKTFLATDESVNSYGFWVLTKGGDLTDFLKNPIALWNHHRSYRGLKDEVLPIGIWTNMQKDGETIHFDFEPDMDDTFAATIGRKVEKGHIKGCSIGIIPLEWSDDAKLMKPGQSRPTITKWKLLELSVCDIPSNKNSLSLYDQEGKLINLSEGGECPIPLLKLQDHKMDELKQLGLALGLGDGVSVLSLTTVFKQHEATINQLKADLAKVKEAEVARQAGEVKTLLDGATEDNRIDGTQRASWEKLFAADHESAANLLKAQTVRTKLADLVQTESDGGVKKYEGMTFSELRTKAPDKLIALKDSNIELFKDLYKSEYGKAYVA